MRILSQPVAAAQGKPQEDDQWQHPASGHRACQLGEEGLQVDLDQGDLPMGVSCWCCSGSMVWWLGWCTCIYGRLYTLGGCPVAEIKFLDPFYLENPGNGGYLGHRRGSDSNLVGRINKRGL